MTIDPLDSATTLIFRAAVEEGATTVLPASPGLIISAIVYFAVLMLLLTLAWRWASRRGRRQAK